MEIFEISEPSGGAASEFSFRLYDRFSAVPKEAWAATVQNRVFLRADYSAAVESSGAPMRYVLFFRRDSPVGGAVFQVAAVTSAPLKRFLKSECPALTLVTLPIKTFRQPWASRVVVCGTPYACGPHGFVFHPSVPSETAGRLLAEAALRAKAALDRELPSAGVLIKEFSPTSRVTDGLAGSRFVTIETEPSMVLSFDPAWRSFEDYLHSLSSKYRVKAKRAYTKSAALCARDLSFSDLSAYRGEASRLFEAVVARASFKLGEPDVGALCELKRRMGDDFIVRGYFLGEHLVGVLTGFVSGDILEAGHVGFDYDENPTHGIYPRMLYDYLQIATAQGLSQVSYGRTAGEIKSTLGAEPTAMRCSLRLERSLLNVLLSMVRRAIQPEPFAFRRPFKKAWYANRAVLPAAESGSPDLTARILDGTSAWRTPAHGASEG